MAADNSEPITLEGEYSVMGERVRPLPEPRRHEPIIGSWPALFWVVVFVAVNILVGWAKNITAAHH